MTHPKIHHPPTLTNQSILVTGAAGSIGRALVRQLLPHDPKVIRAFDQDETQLYYLQDELRDRRLRYLVGDVRDRLRVQRAMHDVSIVFHAAALKHVPSCEYDPFEAVQTNVLGTQNVIEAALDSGVGKLVVISTDKAVDPTNVMGATKLLAEKLVQATSQWLTTLKPVCVRFGNVLGSRGSVAPTILRQIERGGPVTLTRGNMTRFTMTLTDAVALVLMVAGRDFMGGEIVVLKMPALRVADLVNVLIDEYAPLVGRNPADIAVQEITPRPGERTDEMLLSADERDRTQDLGKYLVVHPVFRIPGDAILDANASGPPPDPTVYRASAARCLTRDEIATILRDSGLMVYDGCARTDVGGGYSCSGKVAL